MHNLIIRSIKKTHFICAILIASFGLSGAYAKHADAILVFDTLESEWIITKKFRVNYGLKVSGSGQFSAKELAQLLDTLPVKRNNVWVVDLRQESHGFVNGMPISWTGDKNSLNAGNTPEQIARTEQTLLTQLRGQTSVDIFTLHKLDNGSVLGVSPVNVEVELVQSEQQLTQSLQSKYKRLYVLDHHRPDDATVDEYIGFIKHQVKPGDWLHFHCRGGKGRSSTFIAMYDMLINAQHTSFEQIIKHQVQVGNISLDSIPQKSKKLWKQSASSERYKFLEQFYSYVVDPQGYASQSWSAWLRSQA